MIVGLMRVKNEERWIARSVTSLKRIADVVFMLDDHSTDRTPVIARACGAKVVPSPFEGTNEVRDKDFILEYAIEHAGPFAGNDWAIMIDGDEVIDDPWVILNDMEEAAKTARALSLRVLYYWNDEETIRMDGVYGKFYRPSAWPIGTDPRARFRETEFGGNFHCGSVPGVFTRYHMRSGARIWHYGYMLKEDRIRKYHWYNKMDPNNAVEDGYRHMVVGDLFPESSRFKWGGPLRLAEKDLVLAVTMPQLKTPWHDTMVL
jgi:glycosyltransferase involved in cell wall biosynthesis